VLAQNLAECQRENAIVLGWKVARQKKNV